MPYDKQMKAFALLLAGLASLAVADDRFAVPMIVEGECLSSRNNQTVYVIRLINKSNLPLTDIRVVRVGLYGHNWRYDPPLYIKQIPANRTHTLKITLRGEVFPMPHPRDFGFEGHYFQQRSKYQVSFPQPCVEPPRWNGDRGLR